MPQSADNFDAAWRAPTALWVGVRVLLIIALLLPVGCVRRRLNVYSNPAGAMVYVDNQQIGTTPCSVDFTYYGTREIRLVKPGYETLAINQPIPTPWYQVPPLDFISENLALTKIRDNRTVTYNLEPQLVVPPQQLIERGEQLRRESQQFPVQPAAGAVPAREQVPPEALVPVLPGTFGPPPRSSAPIAPSPATGSNPTAAPLYPTTAPPTGSVPSPTNQVPPFAAPPQVPTPMATPPS